MGEHEKIVLQLSKSERALFDGTKERLERKVRRRIPKGMAITGHYPSHDCKQLIVRYKVLEAAE